MLNKYFCVDEWGREFRAATGLGEDWQWDDNLKQLDYFGEKEYFANLWRVRRLPRDPEFSPLRVFSTEYSLFGIKSTVSMAMSSDFGDGWDLDFQSPFSSWKAVLCWREETMFHRLLLFSLVMWPQSKSLNSDGKTYVPWLTYEILLALKWDNVHESVCRH